VPVSTLQKVPHSVDAVVIGCGVQGASAAYQLAHAWDMTVAVVDRFARGGVASRASAAMVTQQTGHAVTTKLAKESVSLFHDFVAEGWDIGFVTCGYTTFASDASSMQYVEASAEALAAAGVEHCFAVGDDAIGLAKAVTGTFMSASTEAQAAIFVPSDGYVDPAKLVSTFIERAGTGIVRIDSPAEAVRLITSKSDAIAGVELLSGEKIACSVVVNCAGAWAPDIAQQVGLNLPIRRSRRQMAVVHTEPLWMPRGIVEHLSHSDGEWYFRPCSSGVLVGTGSLRWLDKQAPLVERPTPDPEMSHLIGHYLQRNTVAEEFQVARFWAGDRPITYFDPADNAGDALESGGTNVEARDFFPMVGPHPTLKGYIDSCGWGEFGVTLAPVGGVVVAEIVETGALRPDLRQLNNARFTKS
jgi:glycine/D-amino acid oxidase-like deaminating enzyme